jgi:benzodiazapine receptor
MVILINALANILPLNGKLTGAISDSFPVYFVPAGYVFSIWGVIYLLMIAFSFYSFKVAQNKNGITFLGRVTPLYVIAGIANISWLILWHYEFINFTIIPMLLLLVTLILFYLQIQKRTAYSAETNEKWWLLLPASVYLGWICVATIANATVVLYNIGYRGDPLRPDIWAGLLIIIAATLAAVFVRRFKDIPFSLVIIWAIIGIAVKFNTALAITLPVLVCNTLLGILMLQTLESNQKETQEIKNKK